MGALHYFFEEDETFGLVFVVRFVHCGYSIMNPNQVEMLGSLVRVISMLLAGKTKEIGNGLCMNLAIPSVFSDGKCVDHSEAWILPTTPAKAGELLRVNDDVLKGSTARPTLRKFLRCAFDPPVVCGGGIRVVFDEDQEGIIFLTRAQLLAAVKP